MIYCNSLKFSSIWKFHNKKCVEFSLTLKYECAIKTTEMFNYLPLINSVTTGFSLFVINHKIVSSKAINT